MKLYNWLRGMEDMERTKMLNAKKNMEMFGELAKEEYEKRYPVKEKEGEQDK